MKIIIAGAGEVGTHLAKMLSQEKQDIILMDPNEERLNFTNSSMDIHSGPGRSRYQKGRPVCQCHAGRNDQCGSQYSGF